MTILAAWLRQRLTNSARALPRPSAGWIAVRLLAWGLGTVTLLLPLPGFPNATPLTIAAAIAVIPAAIPGTAAVLATQLLAVGGWLFVTWALAEPISPVRLLAFAATLYLHHVVCSFAAFLPHTAAFSPATLARALSRTGVVLATSLILGILVFQTTTWLSADSPLIAPLAGLAATLTLAALLVHLLHRRP